MDKNKLKTAQKKKSFTLPIIIACVVIIFIPLLFYTPNPSVIIEIEPIPSDGDENGDETDPIELDNEIWVRYNKTYFNDADFSFPSDGAFAFDNGIDNTFVANISTITIKDIVASETEYFNNASDHEDYEIEVLNYVVFQVNLPIDAHLKNYSVFTQLQDNSQIFTIWNGTKTESGYYEVAYEYVDYVFTQANDFVEDYAWYGLNEEPELTLQKGVYFFGFFSLYPFNWSSSEQNTDHFNATYQFNDTLSEWELISKTFTYNITFEPVSATNVESEFQFNVKIAHWDGDWLNQSFTFVNQSNDRNWVSYDDITQGAGAIRIYVEPLFWKDITYVMDSLQINYTKTITPVISIVDDYVHIEFPYMDTGINYIDFIITVRLPVDYEITAIYVAYGGYDFTGEIDYTRDGEFVYIPYDPYLGIYRFRIVLPKREGE